MERRRSPDVHRPRGRRRAEEMSGRQTDDLFQVRYLSLSSIDAPKRPARRTLGDMDSLAASMDQYGLQQPITVRANGDRFALTSGLRRLSAARMLGWKTIPAFVRSVDADEAYLLDLVENLQRQDLTPEEEADALSELIRTRGWTLQQVADAIKRSVAYVSKRVRVFEDRLLRMAIAERGLPISTAEEILAVEPSEREPLVERALAEGWDQVRARAILREARHPGAGGRVPDRGRARDIRARTSARRGEPSVDLKRPRGLTRAVKDFHRLIMTVRAQDLSPADRSALRSLFRDLVLLARAPAQARQATLPPLPMPPPPRRARARSSNLTSGSGSHH